VKLEEFLQAWRLRYPKLGQALDNGLPKLYPSQGTYYVQVNCPYCEGKGKTQDKGYHCHVHYEAGWFNCFRCGSRGGVDFLLGRKQNKPKQQEEAWDSYVSTPEDRVIDPRLLNRGRGLEGSKMKPGITCSLESLPKNHPAKAFLRNEGFTDNEILVLAEKYGIYYCVNGIQMTSNPLNTTSGRLIWEIREGGTLYGWQARWLPKNWPPSQEDKATEKEIEKYLFSPGLRKSFILYNWDNAQRWDSWVIVEGAKKVWKTGEFSLASFGISNNPKPPSELEQSALNEYWSIRLKNGNRKVGLLYDKDALSTALSHEKTLREMGIDATTIPLPENGPNDLDDYNKFEIRRLIKTYLGKIPSLL
jgi:hypothetical protein